MELQADIVEREADATRKLGDVKAREDALAREKETLDAEVEEQLTQKLAEAEAKAAKRLKAGSRWNRACGTPWSETNFTFTTSPSGISTAARSRGMEALLRWQHPELGVVAPTRFIPVAEENGLMVPIGKWVLMTACLQNVAWQNEGLPHVSIAVNLTARSDSR
jgi:EAL domain-containing protein (putative c-di-GMP-specific phosphodiesterase class I)